MVEMGVGERVGGELHAVICLRIRPLSMTRPASIRDVAEHIDVDRVLRETVEELDAGLRVAASVSCVLGRHQR